MLHYLVFILFLFLIAMDKILKDFYRSVGLLCSCTLSGLKLVCDCNHVAWHDDAGVFFIYD